MNHLRFGASSPGQVHAIRAAMRDAGFEVPEIQDLGGATALCMKDPDGIRFEITYTPQGVAVVDSAAARPLRRRPGAGMP